MQAKRRPLHQLLALSLLSLLCLPALAAQTWKINLKDADISALVSEVSEITHKTFVIDPRVKGTVTIISSRPMTADAVYELFLSVLSVNGFAAVPAGSAIKLVPDVNAKQSGVPVDLTGMSHGEAYVTRVITLDNASAVELVPVLRPLLPQFAHLAAVASTNALVVSDHASNIDAVEQVIRGLDTSETDGIEAVDLKQMRVDDMLNMLDGLASSGSQPGAPAAGGASKEGKIYARVRVVGDTHNNRLILRGDARARKRLHDMITTLDSSAADQQFSGVKVFHLRHSSAAEVADVVKGIILGEKSTTSTSSAGSTSGGFSAAPSMSSSASSPSGGMSTMGGSTGSTGSTGSSFGSGSSSGGGTVTVSGNGVTMVADENINALVVKADGQMMGEISALINQVDERRSEVLVQAAILEISGDDVKQLGVQWAFGNPSDGVGLINFSDTGTSIASIAETALAASQSGGLAAAAAAGTTTSLPIGDGATVGVGRAQYNSSGKITGFYGALIQALKSVTTANLLSTPSILTLDNQEATIVVGQNVPFITGSSTSAAAGVGNPFQTIERQDVGITLKVIPHIGEGGTVRLEVDQEVSSVVPASSTIKAADIITNKRAIQTVILADDGQTIVLGGLMQDDNTTSASKVPLLGDIPLIGWLFRSKSDSRTKDNLLVFLRPTILHDPTDVTSLTRGQYQGIRTLQLSVSESGDVARLPEEPEGIFQGEQGMAPKAAPSAAPATH